MGRCWGTGGMEGPNLFYYYDKTAISGGGGGIRTRETIHHRLHTFQACAFNRSATPPRHWRNTSQPVGQAQPAGPAAAALQLPPRQSRIGGPATTKGGAGAVRPSRFCAARPGGMLRLDPGAAQDFGGGLRRSRQKRLRGPALEGTKSRALVLGVPAPDALVSPASRRLASRRRFGYIAAAVTGA
jgi:hypothetical protein